MARTDMAVPLPCTQSTSRALRTAQDEAFATDLLFLEAWEIDPSMHPGAMLRIRQIRRANPHLSAEIAAELAMRRKALEAEAACRG